MPYKPKFLKMESGLRYVPPQESIQIKRQVNDFIAACRRNAKVNQCYYCGQEQPQLCNSHAIPAFVLSVIADNGMLYTFNKIVSERLGKDELGLNSAGTFHLICRNCDSRIFADYENPDNYSRSLNQKIYAQIAMKCNLKHIYKTRTQIVANAEMIDSGCGYLLPYNVQEICRLNLLEHNANFKRAKKVAKKPKGDEYFEIFRTKLDYIVPIAAQDSIALVVDFEGNQINKTSDMDPEYQIKNIYVCIFPMKACSEVILFVDSNDSARYRKFYKQFLDLDLESKLLALTCIMFTYSEEIFVSKNIPDSVLNDLNLRDAAKQSNYAVVPNKNTDTTEELKQAFSLGGMRNIPNLLLEDYKL